MKRLPLEQRIKQSLFVLDGAMGTQLFEKGIESGQCNEYLNISSEQLILEINKSYIEAGADAILTNTFGANKISLSRHKMDGLAEEINIAGAKIARIAAGEQKYVIGDIGPTGDFLEPLGNLKSSELRAAYAEQAKILADNGVDGFIIETMSALDEMAVAIEAVRSVCDLPIMASFAYDRAGGDFKTMMGVGIDRVVKEIATLGLAAVGFNCGTIPMADYSVLARRYKTELQKQNINIPILAEPNAGLPELLEGQAKYKLSPEEFAQEAEKIRQSGASIIGGCCGTSPAHISALVRKLRNQD